MEFKIFTNALKAYETEKGDLYVSGTTSSTIRDLHGDEMSMDALKEMQRTSADNMTVFLNHNYNVPEDLFGSVTASRIVKRYDEEAGQEVYDLDIDVRVVGEDENPEAMRAYRAIKRGVKLGLSIGARVEKASRKMNKDNNEESILIEKIRLMEASVVGIPANQRSYLSSALKSIKSAGVDLDLLEGDDFEVKESSLEKEKPEIRGDAPNSEESGVENIMDTELEKKTRVTVTVSTDGDEKKPESDVVASPVVAADDIAGKEEVKASATPEDVEPDDEAVEVVEDDLEEPVVESERARAIEALEALGAKLADAEGDDLKSIFAALNSLTKSEGDESSVQPETAEAEVVAEVAPVVAEAEVVVEAVPASLEEVESIAKSALDAASAAHEEVTALAAKVTELAEDKAKVEADLSKALELIERISALGVGRKSSGAAKVTVRTPENAPWLNPYVQRALEAQDEE